MSALPGSPDATDVSWSGSFIRRHAYFLLSAVVVIAMGGHTLNQIWASPDFWLHLAAVREFGSSLLDPGNPLITGGADDPYQSPYTFLLGAFKRVTGFDAVTVLASAGLANLVASSLAFRRFVMSVSTVEFAPLLALVFTLTAWGVSPWRWSGFFELNSLGTVLPLSSTFASAIGLSAISSVVRWLRNGSRIDLAATGIGAPLLLLCHPMTCVWVGLVGLAFVISEATVANRRRVLGLLTVIVGATVLAAAWPFYSIIHTSSRSQAYENAQMYRVVARTFLAIPGFVVLGLRFVRRHRDPLVLGAVLNSVVYVGSYAVDRDSFGRVLPGIMLMAHVALAIWVAELIPRWRTLPTGRSAAVAVALIVIVVVGLAGTLAGVVRAVPRPLLPARFADDARLRSLVAPYDQLSDLIGRDEVIVATPRIALAVAASSGKAVAPPAPAPFVDDVPRRREIAVAVLSSETSPDTWRRLVDASAVRWIVVTPARAADLETRVAAGALRREASTPHLVAFRVTRPPSG